MSALVVAVCVAVYLMLGVGIAALAIRNEGDVDTETFCLTVALWPIAFAHAVARAIGEGFKR